MRRHDTRVPAPVLSWFVVAVPIQLAAGPEVRRASGSLKSSLMRQMSKGHVWLYRKTGGRFVSMGGNVLILTTIGAKSGAKRTLPVAGYRHGDGWIVVAAAGKDHHPAWYHNLIVHPDVVVEKNGHARRMVARDTGGDERAALWEKVVEAEPSFASMQDKNERVFPVVVLEPAENKR